MTPEHGEARAVRRSAARAQRAAFDLPAFPTTTIGSFPQTEEVRKARAANAKGTLSDADYNAFLRKETEAAVRWQEEIGIDVLVHGEFERNDMVQYFGEQLSGYAFTQHGWVQSYGSRYVRPPIIFGDVSRPQPMTVEWSAYAQSLTEQADEGHADRPGHHAVLVVRPRRHSALARPAARSRWRSATRWWISRRPASPSSRSTSRRSARACRCARADWKNYLDWAVECFRLVGVGREADDADPHAYVLFGVQRHHRLASARWMRT